MREKNNTQELGQEKNLPEVSEDVVEKKEKRPKIYAYSGGCSSDNLDMQRIEDYARANNYPVTFKPEDADIIFVGTCSLTPISHLNPNDLLKW